jgi:hypothetical protein
MLVVLEEEVPEIGKVSGFGGAGKDWLKIEICLWIGSKWMTTATVENSSLKLQVKSLQQDFRRSHCYIELQLVESRIAVDFNVSQDSSGVFTNSSNDSLSQNKLRDASKFLCQVFVVKFPKNLQLESHPKALISLNSQYSTLKSTSILRNSPSHSLPYQALPIVFPID